MYDAQPRPDGIYYRSRLDNAQGCWAVFGHVDVTIEASEPLRPEDPQHREVVGVVAAIWRIPLPPAWQ